jgi:hypothetical protein
VDNIHLLFTHIHSRFHLCVLASSRWWNLPKPGHLIPTSSQPHPAHLQAHTSAITRSSRARVNYSSRSRLDNDKTDLLMEQTAMEQTAMEQTALPLLKAKLFRPQAHANLICRAHLFSSLDRGMSGLLTLVCAPPASARLLSWPIGARRQLLTQQGGTRPGATDHNK